MSGVAIILPVFERDERVIRLVRSLAGAKLRGGQSCHVLAAVDSSLAGKTVFLDSLRELGAEVITIDMLRGRANEIKAGISLIRERHPDVIGVITAEREAVFNDILDIAESMAENPGSFIIGRSITQKRREILPAFVFRVFTGIKLSDISSKLRGIPESMFDGLLSLRGSGRDYFMNMLLSLNRRGIKIIEVPVNSINSSFKNYRAFKDIFLILLQFICTIVTSLASFLIDYLLYILLITLTAFNSGICYIIARVFSSLFNYTLNSRLVFKAGGYRSFTRYYLLALFIMLVGSSLTYLLSDMLGFNRVLGKLIIDIPLFFVSFFGQKHYVFSLRPEKGSGRSGGGTV